MSTRPFARLATRLVRELLHHPSALADMCCNELDHAAITRRHGLNNANTTFLGCQCVDSQFAKLEKALDGSYANAQQQLRASRAGYATVSDPPLDKKVRFIATRYPENFV